jgi:hypothetical protein
MASKKIVDSDKDVKVKLLWREVNRAEDHTGLLSLKNNGAGRPIINWLRTSQFFDGLVNTPARILLNVLSILALYVWGFIVFESEANFVPWAITLFILLAMQAASVRFVFSGEGIADELQLSRRDFAYRRAYKTLLGLSAIPVLVFAYVLAGYQGDTSLAWDFITYRLDTYRSLTLALFVFAVISFQKYFSYGNKGEPFTIREAGKIKD